MTSKLLQDILRDIPFHHAINNPANPSIQAITSDSRLVEPGTLFVAIGGGSSDGHLYIPAAIENGAVAVVGEQDLQGLEIPYLRVQNSRQFLAWLAASFYDFPARRLTMIGVTGTDGKTTTCNLLYQILLAAGIKAGLISTVNAIIGNEVLDTGFHVTTPDSLEVQKYLSKMLASGLTHVILETTSHGWAQYRVDACEFDIGILTNITHEHLDYHGSYENYRAAKARLFTSLAETQPKNSGNIRLGVLNRDDSSYAYLKEIAPTRTISYGLTAEADIHAENIRQTPHGVTFTAVGAQFSQPLQANLFGLYNVSNVLAAFSAAVNGLKISPETAARGIANLEGVPGRMEQIDLGQDFLAIVDFAHTPNALKVTLETSRELLAHSHLKSPSGAPGRLISVFGSAGLRDKEKRRMMAEVSMGLADISILTAEDPRTENLDDILEEMALGARSKGGVEGSNFFRVRDRGDAIRLALKMAHPGDLVISCGKGHEQSMCFGTTEYPWDDRTAMKAALAELLGIMGEEMPYLPTQKMK